MYKSGFLNSMNFTIKTEKSFSPIGCAKPCCRVPKASKFD